MLERQKSIKQLKKGQVIGTENASCYRVKQSIQKQVKKKITELIDISALLGQLQWDQSGSGADCYCFVK